MYSSRYGGNQKKKNLRPYIDVVKKLFTVNIVYQVYMDLRNIFKNYVTDLFRKSSFWIFSPVFSPILHTLYHGWSYIHNAVRGVRTAPMWSEHIVTSMCATKPPQPIDDRLTQICHCPCSVAGFSSNRRTHLYYPVVSFLLFLLAGRTSQNCAEILDFFRITSRELTIYTFIIIFIRCSKTYETWHIQ